MSGEQRLNRVYPALTAKERGLLVLQAYKAHEEPDQLIYDTCPSSQGAQFNRYIRLMNAVNAELATALQLVHEQVEKTDLKYAWMMTALIWGMETQVLGAEALAATKDRKFRKEIRRLMARAPSDLQVPIDVTAPPEEPETFKKGYGDELVRALLCGIRRDVRQHWCELRSVEIVVQEIAEEFDGEDPMQSTFRELLDECLRTCERVRDDVAPYVEIELVDPAEDDVAQVRLLIQKIVDDGSRATEAVSALSRAAYQ